MAGTNGKGSVSGYCAAILAAAGYRVGTFTSPHLRDYRERIRIHDALVSADELVSAFERIEAARGAVALTFFEFNTLAALLVFEAAQLDAWVLEIGMGGRLDAVNVVDPDVAVVVSIGLDHQEYLGATLEAIGREKAGIFRHGRPAVLGSRDMPAVVAEMAREIGAPLKRLGAEYRLRAPGRRLALPRQPLGSAASARAGALGRRPIRQCGDGHRRARRARRAPDGARRGGGAGAAGGAADRALPSHRAGAADGADLDPGCRAQPRCGARAGAQFARHSRPWADLRGVRDIGRQGCRRGGAELRDCIDAWWCVSTDGERGRSGAALAQTVLSQVGGARRGRGYPVRGMCGGVRPPPRLRIESWSSDRSIPWDPRSTGSRRTACCRRRRFPNILRRPGILTFKAD